MAQISHLQRLLTRMAKNRPGYVLDAATVERVCNWWVRKHYYRDWQMRRCLFDSHRFEVWIFEPERNYGHAWYRLYPEIDLEIDPPVGHCAFCGEPTWTRPWKTCGKRGCRAVREFYFGAGSRSWPRKCPGGEAMGPFLLADFLKRMAKPKSARDMEFSKRYAHRRAA